MSADFNVDYRILKNKIIRSCKPVGKEIADFEVDFDRLVENCAELHIVPIYFGLEAKRVTPVNIPFLNEYFKDENLSWFNSAKFLTVLSFIHTDSIDEKAEELLAKLRRDQVDDPADDKVNDVAELLANYPCYSAVVVGYKSNNPKYIKAGKPSFVIQIRANKVTISNSDYQYNYKDIS